MNNAALSAAMDAALSLPRSMRTRALEEVQLKMAAAKLPKSHSLWERLYDGYESTVDDY